MKIEKKTNSKIEQAEFLVSIFCLLSEIKLSKTEKVVLSYYIVYKINQTTNDLILKSKLLANADSLKNVLSKFRKLKLVKKRNKEDILEDKLNISLEPITGMFIKLNNV